MKLLDQGRRPLFELREETSGDGGPSSRREVFRSRTSTVIFELTEETPGDGGFSSGCEVS